MRNAAESGRAIRRIRRIGRIRPIWLAAAVLLLAGCGSEAPPAKVRLFHAAGFTPVLDALRADAGARNFELEAEGSGSQMACRKITELGRRCDLVVLADRELVAEMLGGVCSWRLDFATDEMVLAVGARAPNSELAERDWPAALLADGVRLGRADENLAPVGYRTLLVWKLREAHGGPAGLADRLRARCTKVLDDVGRLIPLLQNGEIDYAFVYRSTCIAQGVRFIALDKAVNLGSADVDYSGAQVTFEKLRAGAKETVTVRGEPICWTLTIPDGATGAQAAGRFASWLLAEKADVLKRNGLRPLSPALLYGPAEKAGPFGSLARRAGDLK
ncbi:MAG TPA: substrate-binding domain-containing protein [Planctomycetota bacterium]|nr:substrate-binding domain-containing protein [Planctomycetota bacterium]